MDEGFDGDDARNRDGVAGRAATPAGDAVTSADRAALRRIRVRASIWLAAFLALLACAVAAGADRAGATPLGRVYPWLAIVAFVVGVGALTYLIGWRRAAALIRDAEDGDRVAAAYLRRGPQLGTVDWWWTQPPVRPSSERRRVLALGAIQLVAAALLLGIDVALAVSGVFADAGMSGFPLAIALSCVPLIAVGAWCVAFRFHPTERRVRTLRRMQWALFAYGLVGLAVVGLLSRGVAACAAYTTVVVFAGSVSRAVTPIARMALPDHVVVADTRAAIDEDIARRVRAEAQVPSVWSGRSANAA
ncbi:hypothetical protein [Bifidobacterium parmae]|uniref:Uncharacterized protein n=1 Tax=Bifidobacterium parmae TaxID=361854 RepID=A0A2N5J6K0_9BIFI|nr:hypothetical protein [Bifidobacterium parmae]PLS29835.1 hypothetical protein Uis4E_0176 [Bifidobacterium parmae]